MFWRCELVTHKKAFLKQCKDDMNVINYITQYCYKLDVDKLTVPNLVVVDVLHGEGRILIEFFMV